MPSMAEFIRQSGQARQTAAIPLDEPVPIEDLPTPALMIDLDVFEGNLHRMQDYLNGADMGLRAHTKMHKCPIIAKKQIELGASGVCAAKVSEAEVMHQGGIKDILITSPLVTRDKLRRVVDLMVRAPDVKVVVDQSATADLLNQMAAAEGIIVGVFIDLDPGMGRTGIETGQPALRLAQHIADYCPSLSFMGLQMYAGNCMHTGGFDRRCDKYRALMEKGEMTRELFSGADIEVPTFSGGGTGTYNIEPSLGLLTELQAGSYAFMDIEYRDIGNESGPQFDEFGVSLLVLVTAISQPQQRLITVDAGFKSFASDKMAPEFRDVEGVTFHWGGDEHGIVQLNNPSRTIALGDKLAMLTPHCDPTVNLHDYYFPCRDGVVSEIWPVAARGCSQ